jgi:hypothetical protein
MTRSVNTTYDVPYGDVTTAVGKFFQELGKAGNVVVEQMKTNPTFVRRLAKYAIAGTYGEPTTVERAKEIMGKNFISADVVHQFLTLGYTPAEQIAMRMVPYPEEDLLATSESHLLVPGVHCTVDQLYERTNGRVHYIWSPKTWCWKGSHASQEIIGAQWYLIRKGAVPKSLGRTWAEQQMLLSYKEIVPRACEVFFAALMNYMVTKDDEDFGTEPNPFADLRCSDVVKKRFCRPRQACAGPHVCSPTVNNSIDNSAHLDTGLASRWRLPSEI